MRRIDSEDLEFLGKELQLLQRMHQRAIVGVTFDIRIELRSEKVAADHVTLKLRHIDAVSGEAAERFVERGRQVADLEYEGRDHLAVAGLGPALLAREYNEPGGRVRLVLDVLFEDIQPINFRGKA